MSRILKEGNEFEVRRESGLLPRGADTWNALEPIRPTVL